MALRMALRWRVERSMVSVVQGCFGLLKKLTLHWAKRKAYLKVCTVPGLRGLSYDADNAISFATHHDIKPAHMPSKNSLLTVGTRTRLIGAALLSALLWLGVAWACDWQWGWGRNQIGPQP